MEKKFKAISEEKTIYVIGWFDNEIVSIIKMTNDLKSVSPN